MSETKINWYSIGLNQKVEEHEPIDLKQALAIVDRYISNAGQKYKSDKEAIASSMFGFSKSKKDFIELCVFGPDQFSHTFEYSYSQRIFGRICRREEDLHSKDNLIKKVTAFFNTPSEELAKAYENKKKQTKSPLRIPAHASLTTRIFIILLGSILGLGMFFITVQGIFTGKLPTGSKYSAGRDVLLSANPIGFWIFAALYFAMSVWLIRGCVLESKITQRMFSNHKKGK